MGKRVLPDFLTEGEKTPRIPLLQTIRTHEKIASLAIEVSVYLFAYLHRTMNE